MTLPPYLETLNEDQQRAVFHDERPLLILAGAGSGKTRVITTKIAYLIREKHASPRSILAVTFTNKAAKEMAERAAQIESRAENCMLRTFHSFGAYFLRCYGEYADINSNFLIYDDDDSIALLQTIMTGAKKNDVKMTAHCIGRAKDYFISPDSPQLDEINRHKGFRKIYKEYEERLRKTGNVDFGDLIKLPVEILKANNDLRERIQSRFRIIMVDEYQDANVAQFELLRALCNDETYVCVVGDDDQSIYKFRGAEVDNILEFPKRFKDAEGNNADIIKLEQNYRSTKYILDVADSVVRKNTGRLGKTLSAWRGDGKKPTLAFLSSQDEEVSFCANLIKKSIADGSAKYSDWAILYRVNAQSAGFESAFVRAKIPYKIVGTLKFFEREEIKDAIALLSFMVNPKDEVSFRRVINKPSRGLGKVAVEKILVERFNTDDWNIEVAAKNTLKDLSASAVNGVQEFLNAIECGRKTINDSNAKGEKGVVFGAQGLSLCIAALVNRSRLTEHYSELDEVQGGQKIANLQELANNSSVYAATSDGLSEFLERIQLDRSAGNGNEDGESDKVTLITIHTTKGLEFKRVILSGLEQGLFPHDGKAGEDLEEERRLFYVGVTRAMDSLYLTSCAQRRMYGHTMWASPSLFLHEADKTKMTILGDVPYGFKIPKAENKNQKTEIPKAKTSSDGRWSVGDRVFHEDHGYGSVCKISEDEEGAVIKVVFETGESKQFLSAVQSSSFMKIKD
ncbi:MAG: UvrD-helicase domain-containing protein [Termitinemataceae bacterium]|nr:MAG: UvrD-helicase domain-containing protein [Termitinemataceae bacterium]